MTIEQIINNHRLSILIIEDSLVYQFSLREALGEDFNLIFFSSAEEGEDWLLINIHDLPDLILLDLILPGMDGLVFLKKIRTHNNLKKLGVIMITDQLDIKKKKIAFNLNVLDFITKPFQLEEVVLRIKAHSHAALAKKWLHNQNELLSVRVKAQVEETAKTRDAVIICMAHLAELRDDETGGHLQRTKFYFSTILKSAAEHPILGKELDDMDIDLICTSAPLHDIGKVGIPDYILHKPDKLSLEERDIMKTHCVIGHEVLSRSEFDAGVTSLLKHASRIALSHHEKWNGSGYPYGLGGRSIPIEARIMAVADVFDALISRRVYKDPMPKDRALQIIEEGRGNHFDPLIVDMFFVNKETILEYSQIDYLIDI